MPQSLSVANLVRRRPLIGAFRVAWISWSLTGRGADPGGVGSIG